jgi:hypothetical protein
LQGPKAGRNIGITIFQDENTVGLPAAEIKPSQRTMAPIERLNVKENMQEAGTWRGQGLSVNPRKQIPATSVTIYDDGTGDEDASSSKPKPPMSMTKSYHPCI